jgi:hypothetical protein
MEAFSNSNFGFLGLGEILELELLGGMHGFPVVVSGKKKNTWWDSNAPKIRNKYSQK